MIVVVTRTDNQKEVIRVKNTYYFPGLHTSVISHQLLNDSGFWFDDRNRTWKHKLISFKAVPYRGLFLADTGHFKLTRSPASTTSTTTPSPTSTASPTSTSLPAATSAETPLYQATKTAAAGSRLRLPFSIAETAVWHRRLGHPGPEKMELILKQSEGINIKGPSTVECDICAQSKAKRIEYNDLQTTRISSPFGHVQWDLFEYGSSLGRPGRHLSIRKCPSTGFIIQGTPAGRDKESLWQEVVYFDLFLQRQYGIRIRIWQCDGEKGLAKGWNITDRSRFEAYGIRLIDTSPHTPHENGSAERAGGVIDRLIRCILYESGLPQYLWPWIANLAIYLHNRLPQARLDGKSPMQAFNSWLKKNVLQHYSSIDDGPANLKHLKTPGCRAYPLTSQTLQRKDKVASYRIPRA